MIIKCLICNKFECEGNGKFYDHIMTHNKYDTIIEAIEDKTNRKIITQS